MTLGTITIQIHQPTLRERADWYALQVKLRAAEPFVKPTTAAEWYAADCPPYAGQKPPWWTL